MRGSSVRGVKNESTLDDAAFVKFFDVVQREARKADSVFFLWTSEGREGVCGDFQCEDLSGWLIPEEEADEFESQWIKGVASIGDRFEDSIRFARWSGLSGTPDITFEK